MGRTACTEPQCLYKGALYLTVELYLYSPYGPYRLYTAAVPVQGCTLPSPFYLSGSTMFNIISQTTKIWGEERSTEQEICALIVSTTLCATFLILIIVQRDIATNVLRC